MPARNIIFWFFGLGSRAAVLVGLFLKLKDVNRQGMRQFCFCRLALVFVLGLAVIAAPVLAQNTTYTWTGNSSGNWNNGGNWSGGQIPLPNPNTAILFTGTRSLTTSQNVSGSVAQNAVTFDRSAGAFVVNGGALEFETNALSAGPTLVQNSAATVTLNTRLILDNTLTLSGSGNLALNGAISGAGGLTQAGSGMVTLSGTSTYTGGTTVNSGALSIASGGSITPLTVSVGGSGILDQTGTVTVGSDLFVDASSTYTLHGAGALNVGGGEYIGYGSAGVFNQTGGTNTTVGFVAGYSANGLGTCNLSVMGVLQVNGDEILGYGGEGVFNQTGGTHTINGNLRLAVQAGSTGTYNLQGGTLEVGAITGGGAGRAIFDFNGGTLQASTSSSLMDAGVIAYVQTGGAIIDTDDNPIIASSLFHDPALGSTLDGGLTKTGTGILSLTGVSTYTGSTTVNGGTLTLESGGSITTKMDTSATGSTLSVNSGSFNVNGGTLTNYYINVGSGGSSTTAIFNIYGGTVNAGSITLTGSSATGTEINQSGGTVNAKSVSVFGNGSSSGAYNLSGTGTISAESMGVGVNSSGTSGQFNQTGGSVVISGSSSELAVGISSGTFGSASSYYNLSGGSLTAPLEYIGFHSAGIFNQTGGTNTVIDFLVLGITPYQQPAGLTNIYNLQGGTLIVPQIAGEANTNIFNFDGGTLQASADASQLFYIPFGNLSVYIQAGGAIVATADNDAITIPLQHDSHLGNTLDGGLSKRGTGTLTLSANNTYTGATTIKGGTLAVVTGGSINNNSLVDVEGGGTLAISGGNVTSSGFQMGNTASPNVAVVNFSGGTLTTPEIDVANGANSSAVFNWNGGTLAISKIVVANGAGSIGTFNQGQPILSMPEIDLADGAGSTGTYNLQGGTLAVGSIQGGSGASIFDFNGGTLQLVGAASDFQNSVLNMSFGILRSSAGANVGFDNARLIGGSVGAGGLYDFRNGTMLTSTTVLPGARVNQTAGTVEFNVVTFSGTFNQSAGTTLDFNGGYVTSAGTATVNGTVNTSGVEIDGVTTINSGGRISNSDSNLTFGGSRTKINAGGTLETTGPTTIEVNGGLLVNNGTIIGTTNVNYGSTLKGSGSFGVVNVGEGAIFSPGNSPGLATVAGLTFNSGSVYQIEIADMLGLPGMGYDSIRDTGLLTLAGGATPGTKIVFDLYSLAGDSSPGLAENFDPTQSLQLVLVQADGGITGFDPNTFAVDTSYFLNDLQGGTFSILPEGNNLVLDFTPVAVPEPSTFAFLGPGLLFACLAAGRRTRRRKPQPAS